MAEPLSKASFRNTTAAAGMVAAVSFPYKFLRIA